LRGEDYDAFAAIGDDTPVTRKLSLLIRPAFVAAPGCAFAWGDWANIEARLLPWLSADPKAQYRLDNFRAVDADPTIPDIYKVTAARELDVPIDGMSKKLRQVGKVIELAAGFGGSTNAMLTMAASYRIHMTDAEAKRAVSRWRKDNRWAVNFWGRHDEEGSSGIWGAVNKALLQPDTPFAVGRVKYLYGRRDGALYCRLPSGRYLIYRKIKWERVNEIDEDTGEILSIKRELMFSRDTGRLKVWPGLMCENIVQATAADILRQTLVRLENENIGLATRAHTHDEVLVEDREDHIEATGERVREIMERGFDWSTDLPIKADIEIGRWYTKHEELTGL
jgi:DNA polymerase